MIFSEHRLFLCCQYHFLLKQASELHLLPGPNQRLWNKKKITLLANKKCYCINHIKQLKNITIFTYSLRAASSLAKEIFLSCSLMRSRVDLSSSCNMIHWAHQNAFGYPESKSEVFVTSDFILSNCWLVAVWVRASFFNVTSAFSFSLQEKSCNTGSNELLLDIINTHMQTERDVLWIQATTGFLFPHCGGV